MWIVSLCDLNLGQFLIEYVPGKSNVIADNLSRTVDLGEFCEVRDKGYKLPPFQNYVAIPGGPNSLFQALSYALHGTITEHQTIRHRVIERLMKDSAHFRLTLNKKTKFSLASMLTMESFPVGKVFWHFHVDLRGSLLFIRRDLGLWFSLPLAQQGKSSCTV